MVREIVPLIRLSCRNSIKLAKAINSPIIVIPIYDLISDSTANPNEVFKKIKEAGGLHKFLDYNGIIILSSIMKDDLIRKFNSPEQYAEIINSSRPEFYFTPDGTTYESKENVPLTEIVRLSKLTMKLVQLCSARPIGLVKGSNSHHIRQHRDFLKSLGINIFAFHASDFFRQGNDNMIRRAKHYCSLIKKEDNLLLIYGLGSPKLMLEFSFSDFFITYTHFVNAKYGKIFSGKKKEEFSNMSVYEAAFHSFKELSIQLKKLKYQTKLFTGGKNKWEEDLQEPQFVIQNQKIKK